MSEENKNTVVDTIQIPVEKWLALNDVVVKLTNENQKLREQLDNAKHVSISKELHGEPGNEAKCNIFPNKLVIDDKVLYLYRDVKTGNTKYFNCNVMKLFETYETHLANINKGEEFTLKGEGYNREKYNIHDLIKNIVGGIALKSLKNDLIYQIGELEKSDNPYKETKKFIELREDILTKKVIVPKQRIYNKQLWELIE